VFSAATVRLARSAYSGGEHVIDWRFSLSRHGPHEPLAVYVEVPALFPAGKALAILFRVLDSAGFVLYSASGIEERMVQVQVGDSVLPLGGRPPRRFPVLA
jgi:hypothetical protein